MTFQQLRNFCMMSEYESLTKASEALFITQPALSMALKNIEAEVGATLFDRRGKIFISIRTGASSINLPAERSQNGMPL